MVIEICDKCNVILHINKSEDFFEETENGSFVFCEKCWLEHRNIKNAQ